MSINRHHDIWYKLQSPAQDLYDEAVLLAVEAFAHTLHDIIFEEDIEQGVAERNSSELDQCLLVS